MRANIVGVNEKELLLRTSNDNISKSARDTPRFPGRTANITINILNQDSRALSTATSL